MREARRSMWNNIGSVDEVTTEFNVKSLVVDNEYYFQVKAVNAEGESLPLESDDTAKPRKKIGEIINIDS